MQPLDLRGLVYPGYDIVDDLEGRLHWSTEDQLHMRVMFPVIRRISPLRQETDLGMMEQLRRRFLEDL